MKKTYISPKTMEVKIGICRMVCASDGTLDKTQTIERESDFGARRGGSLWDDDDED